MASITTIDENQTKLMLKEVLVELIEERRSEFSDIILEVIADGSLANAIREGRRGDFVEEEEVFAILEED